MDVSDDTTEAPTTSTAVTDRASPEVYRRLVLFTAVNAATFVFHVRTVPETRGRSMEALESHFRQKLAA